MSKTIRRIVFLADGATVTCVVGEQIVSERPRRHGRRVNPYLRPLQTIDMARVVAIEDVGSRYHVFWDLSSGPSMWANPILVGKDDTLDIEFED